MIRAIIAIDSKRGLADDKGIPWELPGDQKYFTDHLRKGTVLMGYHTYKELKSPFGSHDNYVATTSDEPLRPGFITTQNARRFLIGRTDDVWNIGGAGLLNRTLDLVEELYITQLEGHHGTTKFVDDYTQWFEKVSESKLKTENGIRYTFQVWHNTRYSK